MQLVRDGFDQLVERVSHLVDSNANNNVSLTCQFGVQLIFGQRVVEDESIVEDQVERYISNRSLDIFPYSIHQFLEEGAQRLDEKIAAYTETSSGYTVKKVTSLEFIFIKKNDLIHRGSSYIPTPKELIQKKAIINIKNKNIIK